MTRAEHLFVFRPGAIGDTLLALPALSALKVRLRPHRVTFVCHSALVPLLALNRVADSVLSADDPALLPLFAGRAEEVTARLRSISHAVLWTSDPEDRLRQTLTRSGADDIVVAPSRPKAGDRTHAAVHLLHSVDERDFRIPQGRLLSVPDSILETVRPRVQNQSGDRTVVVHPGSGSARKNWPLERFAETIRNLQDRGWSIALLAGAAEDQIVHVLLKSLEAAPAIVAREWPLEEVAALLELSDAYLGNDSGISHLAGCLGARGAALYGPTDPAVWGPLGRSLAVIHRQPLEEITPYEVLQALLH